MKPKQMHPVLRKVICTCYNCPKSITCLIFGNEHKPHHKIITGIIIIIMGGVIGDVQLASSLFYHIVQGSCSRFIEAMGSVPIIEHLGKIANNMASAAKPEPMSTHDIMEMENAINGISPKPRIEPIEEHSNISNFVA